jgi:hypothetical protein
MRTRIVFFGLIAAGAIAAPAMAGYYSRTEVLVDSASRYASGSLIGAREAAGDGNS